VLKISKLMLFVDRVPLLKKLLFLELKKVCNCIQIKDK
jgi:hypothetical protein